MGKWCKDALHLKREEKRYRWIRRGKKERKGFTQNSNRRGKKFESQQ